MSIKRPLWITAAILLGLGLAAGQHMNAKDRAMFTKVMMYYGSWDNEEMFDATQWFRSGQYEPRPGFERYRVTMLRTRPMPFTSAQLEKLSIIASVALDEHYPKADNLKLLYEAPDLSKRMRYAYSKFFEPNQPVDYYYLYVELDSIRYVVTFDRDGQSGELAGRIYRAEAIIGEYASQAEHRKVFEEIEAEERRQGLRE